MRKIISKYKGFVSLFVIALLVCPFVLTSCGDDDGIGDSNVVGTWVGDDYNTFYSNVTITFNADGTGSATAEHVGAYVSAYRGQFTYKVKGRTITTNGILANANSDGETSTQSFNNTYELSGNKLVVKSGTNWYTENVHSYKKK